MEGQSQYAFIPLMLKIMSLIEYQGQGYEKICYFVTFDIVHV